jgi:hypothetical protein
MHPSSGANVPQLEQLTSAFLRLSLGRKVTLVAAVLGLLSTFLHWYGVSVDDPPFSYSAAINGWHGWGDVAILGYIVAGALSLLFRTGTTVPGLIPSLPPSVTDARLVMSAGAVAVLATVLFILTEGSGGTVTGISQGPSFGAYLGLLCAFACVTGGFLLDREPAQVPQRP